MKIFTRVMQYVRMHGIIYTGVRIWQRSFAHVSRKYTRWFETHQPNDAELATQRAYQFDNPLKFSIIVPVYNTKPVFLRELADSFLSQTYSDWEACLLDGKSTEPATIQELQRLAALDPRFRVQHADQNLGISGNSNLAITMATGDYLAFCDHDDLYTPDALFCIRQAIDETGAEFLYSDEDKLLNGHLYEPHLKPDFSPDFLRSANYICHLMVYSRDLMSRLGGLIPAYDGSQDHDLILRATEQAKGICHIPRVLYHWRMFPKSASHTAHQRCVDAACAAVRAHLARCNETAEVIAETPFLRVRYTMTETPSISLILWGKATERYLSRLLSKTTYHPLEVIVCNNQQMESSIAGIPIHSINSAESSLFTQLNAAARAAKGSTLCFLHAGLLPKSSDWLTELVSHSCRPRIGAVTTAITDIFGRITHAGYAVMADHTVHSHHRGRLFNAPGYMFYERAIRNVSAVSCACMTLRRDLFLRFGGFDERYETSFADVDLCLRLNKENLFHVYSPYAQMKGCWKVTSSLPKDLLQWQKSWPQLYEPYYNQQFQPGNAQYRL